MTDQTMAEQSTALVVQGPNGDGLRLRGAADIASIPVSSYLQYLPQPFQADTFVGRYLMIVETILSSIEGKVDNLPYYFDPMVTPAELLPWLASWVGVELDENMPLAKRRAVVAASAGLYRWQGTRRSLREHLHAYAGTRPLIVENFDGLRLGQDAALGVNTRLGRPMPNSIAITVLVDRLEDADQEVVRRIVEREKPAHVSYSVEIRPRRRAAPAMPGLALLDSETPPTPVAPWIVRQPPAPLSDIAQTIAPPAPPAPQAQVTP